LDFRNRMAGIGFGFQDLDCKNRMAGIGWQESDLDFKNRMAGIGWQESDGRNWMAGIGWQELDFMRVALVPRCPSDHRRRSQCRISQWERGTSVYTWKRSLGRVKRNKE
jgi:hypothetical protein